MRAVVGVDAMGAYKPALCLLARLGMTQPAVTLIHACRTEMPFAFPSADAHVQAAYAKVAQNQGVAALDHAVDEACRRQLMAKTKLIFSPAAEAVINEVDSSEAELVAVCATHAGSGDSYIGSVSRALAIGCPASLLVAKGPQVWNKPLKVVFATDHSAFAQRCLERFIEMNLKGIGEVIVLSAYELDDHECEALNRNLPMLGGDVDRWLVETVESGNAKAVAKLKAAGYDAKALAVRGKAVNAIRDTMAEASADLVIVGSHGAGHLDRARIGSVSLHQVVAESYPVLVIRP